MKYPAAKTAGYFKESKLVIEVDSGQHYSTEGKEKDRMRDDYMKGTGITVLRFSDREVLRNPGAVLEEIRIFDFSKEGKREGEN